MRISSRSIALLVILAAGLSLSTQGQSSPTRAQEAAVRAVLDSQVKAWNQHDLEAFMAGYWNSPELTFFSGATETHGWQATLDRYRKKYQAAGTEMGKLEFHDLQVEMLGPDAAARTVHPGLSPVSRRLEDHPRPQQRGVTKDLVSQ